MYLTLDGVGSNGAASSATAVKDLKSGEIALGVIVEPLLPWLWAGGLIMGIGGLLALAPEVRRRRTSAPEGVTQDVLEEILA